MATRKKKVPQAVAAQATPASPLTKKMKVRYACRYFYDLQRLRLASGARNKPKAEPAQLDADDAQFLERQADGLLGLEKDALKEVKRLLRGVPIYEEFLDSKQNPEQKGIGPTLAGVLVSEINIENCDTPSKLWAWCGLAVKNGKAQRREKGQKAGYNPWLKAKIVKIMAECLVKANSPWRKHYDDYKHRKTHQLVDKCMLCDGAGTYDKKPCTNCKSTGGPAPWGRSDAHRHQAALRYMVKQFTLALWRKWRELEGLPIVPPYSEAMLGRVHGDHGGAGDQLKPRPNGNGKRPTDDDEESGYDAELAAELEHQHLDA